MKKNYKIFDYATGISERTHPQQENNTVFYRKEKAELSLKNPGVTYRKRREKLIKK